MISLFAVFWLLVGLFAIIGAMRGWSKEVIVMAGLILSLFTINTFGRTLIGILGGPGSELEQGGIQSSLRQQFYVLGLIHILIAFFSYQGVAFMRSRLSGRERFQERLLGFIFGALNGYLIVAMLWALLEYQVTADGWVRLTEGFPYAFDPLVTRPVLEVTPVSELLMTHMPLPWLSPVLPILLVVTFLFVIIVVI